MRAITITEAGGPDVLKLSTQPAPELGHNDVLIRVAYAGVNRPDLLQRQGSYAPPPGASPLPGLEVSGIIEALGAGVRQWQVGQMVCALANGGGYAELVAVPQGQILPLPDGFPLDQAAALPETLFTVWSNLYMRAGMQPGESLLVHGGSSGIGSMAIQLAGLMGQTCYVTVKNQDKADYCLALGAEAAIVYPQQDFVAEVKALTDKRGVDVILDMVAGDYIARDMQCLALDGRLVIIATQGGVEAGFHAAQLMVKRQTITGSTLRPQSEAQKQAIADDIKARIWPAILEGRLHQPIQACFDLEQASAAHRLLDSGDVMGKIVLKVAD